MAFDRMQSFGPSKLGFTSVAEQRAMDAQTRAVQNSVQEQKRTERLGRRAYRAAARGKDPSNYIKGIDALEKMRAINGSSGAGIKMAGVRQQGIEQGLQSTRSQIDAFNGKTVDEQGRIAPRPQSRLLGSTSSDGSTVDSVKSSSGGGEWVDVSNKPAPTSESSSFVSASPGLSRLQAKWAAEDPAAQQAAYEAREGTPAQQTEASRPTPPSSGPDLFTPAERLQLRRMVGLTSQNPDEVAQVRGEMALQGLASRVSNTSLSDVGKAVSGGVGALASRLMGGISSGREALGALASSMPPRTPAAALLPTPSARPDVAGGAKLNVSALKSLEALPPLAPSAASKLRAKWDAEDKEKADKRKRNEQAPGRFLRWMSENGRQPIKR